jgi:hypothetical protein
MQLEGLPKGQYVLTRTQGGQAVSEVLIKR